MLFHNVKATIVIFITSIIMFVRVEAAATGDLLFVGPNFDTRPPFGRLYAQVCEHMLFTGPSWMIRYHSATESVTTALSVSREPGGRFRVTVRQAKPQLGSVVANAFWRKSNLESALAVVNIKAASAEVPGTVAEAIRTFWLSLLRRVRPGREPEEWNIAADEVILYGKGVDGKVIGGKFPRDADRYANLIAVEDVVDDLIRICVEPKANHEVLFKKIEREALPFKPAR